VYEERDKLREQLEQQQQANSGLRSELQDCRDVDRQTGIDIDKQLLSLQIRLEQTATILDFNRHVDTAANYEAATTPNIINNNNNSFTLNYNRQNNINNNNKVVFFDMEDIQNMTNEGVKRHDVSSLVERYESEHAYIDSLNLKRVVNDVFKTLEHAMTTIHEHTGAAATDSLAPPSLARHFEFNYDVIQTLTQHRDNLSHFNGRFSRFVTQLLALFDYNKHKEKMHLTQIESLAEQNQVLFDENCALQKQIQLRN
jgi:hypothetical protein